MTDPAACHVVIPAAGSSRRLARLTRDKPKALLEVAGKPLVVHSLDSLVARGFSRVTLIVGYRHERLVEALGERHRSLALDYVLASDYATTEHGWSLYLARSSWERGRRPVLLIDADNLYHPALLDTLMRSPEANVVLVDEGFETGDREEELVLGRAGAVTGLVRAKGRDIRDLAGGFVGMNRFSAPFMGELFRFMERFLAEHGREQKYERVLDRFIAETSARVHYVGTGDLPWVNINHEAELERARSLAAAIFAGPSPDGGG